MENGMGKESREWGREGWRRRRNAELFIIIFVDGSQVALNGCQSIRVDHSMDDPLSPFRRWPFLLHNPPLSKRHV
jgi:hypothetical protein